MKVYIFYDSERLKKNCAFAQMLADAFKSRGAQTKVLLSEEFDFTDLPDIAVMRTANYSLSRRLEEAGVKVSNNSNVCKICNDKYLTYEFFKKHNFAHMPTRPIKGGKIPDGLKYPQIIKSSDGHGGSEVFWANSRNEASDIARGLGGKPAIIQQPAQTLGKDLRVYVLDGKIVAGALRTNNNDFRSNYSLGGSAEIIKEVPQNIAQEALRAASLLNMDYGGIDFIFDGDRPVLNEIEDIAGARMLYNLTDLNIARLYAQFLLNNSDK